MANRLNYNRLSNLNHNYRLADKASLDNRRIKIYTNDNNGYYCYWFGKILKTETLDHMLFKLRKVFLAIPGTPYTVYKNPNGLSKKERISIDRRINGGLI